jgi:hypothetical protein
MPDNDSRIYVIADAQEAGPRMSEIDDSHFTALKLALQVYAQARAALPAEQRGPAVLELGELLVSVVGVADRLDVDLVRAAEDHVTRRAANVPRLVTAAGARHRTGE